MANTPDTPPTDDLMCFIAALHEVHEGREVKAIPSELRALARRALDVAGWNARHLSEDDLMQELVAQVLDRAARSGDEPAGDLAAMDGRALRGTLFVRMKRIASSLSPTWNLRRALAAHVKAALDELASVPPVELPPVSIFAGDRLGGTEVSR